MENIYNEEQLAAMKDEFIELIGSVERDGFKVKSLLDKLESSDFYTAPASTKYHGSYVGGLLDHSLAVYHNLVRLVENKGLEGKYDSNCLKIVGLLHDISKMNTYETTYTNKKVYSENGSKYDNNGNYDWVSVESYKVKDDVFTIGSHEATSEYMLSKFCPLTRDETEAILHHHGGMSWDSSKMEVAPIYSRNSLACLLHLADMIATYVDNA